MTPRCLLLWQALLLWCRREGVFQAIDAEEAHAAEVARRQREEQDMANQILKMRKVKHGGTLVVEATGDGTAKARRKVRRC